MSGAPRACATAVVLVASFVAGSVPFSQLAAGCFAGVDLRQVGSGTVSGSGLYEVAGFGPLAVAGVLEVAKGAAGPLLARLVPGWPSGKRAPGEPRSLTLLDAAAAGAAIAAHNWSPWLRGAGGRGLSPALGATLALAPEGTAVLVAGMVAGRLLRQSGISTLLATLGLVPVLGVRRGWRGAALGLSICAPVLTKRVLGNHPLGPRAGSGSQRAEARTSATARFFSRLLFDREPGTRDAAAPDGDRSLVATS